MKAGSAIPAIVARAAIYAALFISFFLVFVPARILGGSLARPAAIGAAQIAGAAVVLLGGALAVWCILAFAVVGKGTPAPFDPPRALVVRGPYRFVRNPLYIAAVAALAGAALFYRSWPLLGYAAGFFVASHLLVIAYEEPTLQRSFGADYDAYRRGVRRWLPRLRGYLVAGR